MTVEFGLSHQYASLDVIDEPLRDRQLDTEQSKVCIGIFSTVQYSKVANEQSYTNQNFGICIVPGFAG